MLGCFVVYVYFVLVDCVVGFVVLLPEFALWLLVLLVFFDCCALVCITCVIRWYCSFTILFGFWLC